jgi:ribonuclease HII
LRDKSLGERSLDELVGGIDEAGRGSLIGPLVIAGVAVLRSELDTLKKLGVKDSKKLTPSARKRLFEQIVRISKKLEVIEVSPQEIDLREKRGLNLNELELAKMAQISKALGCSTIYVDAVDTDEVRFGVELSKRVPGVNFVSEHKADSKYVVTSAASIVAKVVRDERIEEIKSKYGDVGSGYPSDQRTLKFVTQYFVEHGTLPEFVRKSWKTLLKVR